MHVRPAWRRPRVSLLAAIFIVATATAARATQSDVPSPWQVIDIGSPALPGSATASSGTFNIIASGDDIWGSSDQFTFVYLRIAGDVDLMARVDRLADVNAWSKAGVMIRSALTANA